MRVKIVEFDISHIDGEVILLSDFGIIPTNLVSDEFAAPVADMTPDIGGLVISTRFELSNNFIGNFFNITKLKDMRFGSLLFGISVLALESLDTQLTVLHGRIKVLHPVDGEKITKA